MSPMIQQQVVEELSRGRKDAHTIPVRAGELSLATLPRSVLPSLTETQIQQELIRWWAVECKAHKLDEELLMAFPLQGARTKANASRMKAEGMRRGTPDLFLAVPRGDRGGLWIEMKRVAKGSVLSPHQKAMLKRLSVNYGTVVCRSVPEAKAVIRAYLGLC